MSEPAAKSKSTHKSSAKTSVGGKSKTAPVRIGRSPITGGYILAPYPKKGGTVDPKLIREAVNAVVASRKA